MVERLPAEFKSSRTHIKTNNHLKIHVNLHFTKTWCVKSLNSRPIISVGYKSEKSICQQVWYIFGRQNAKTPIFQEIDVL
jgi:hypothetical protein